jgi:hypothetical protein
MLQGAKDRISIDPRFSMVGRQRLPAARIEAGIEDREGLNGSLRPEPKPFAPRSHGNPDEPAQPGEHMRIPQYRVAPDLAAFSDQPVRVAHVPDSQEV